MNEQNTARTAQKPNTITKSKVDGSKLDQQKCLICPQATEPDKFYCPEHARFTQIYYENWKWDQQEQNRLKIFRATNQHLKDKSPDYICQPANCPELKAAIEKEVNHG